MSSVNKGNNTKAGLKLDLNSSPKAGSAAITRQSQAQVPVSS